MNWTQIILAAISGTVLMTSFSYLVSAAYRKLFKEPVLLQYVMRLMRINIGSTARWFAGWIIHFLIGLIFVILFDIVWRYTDIPFCLPSTLVLGAIAGVIGITGWMIIFSLPSEKPKVHYREYFVQLFIAHLFFALGVWAVYRLYA